MEYNKLIAEMSLSDEVEGFYVLKAAYPKTTATGKPFLSASLSDRSGSIEIKVRSGISTSASIVAVVLSATWTAL